MAFNIGFVLFPNVTQLDLTGPLQVLHRLPQARAHVAAKSLEPVASDCGLSLVPTTSFAACEPLDLLCVPGGFGVSGAIADADTIDFVRRQAARAKYVTSVCTGAFVLGVAGLLKGHHALGVHGPVAARRRRPCSGAGRARRQRFHRRRRDGRDRFRALARRGGGGQRGGRAHSAFARIRSCAALHGRQSAPCAGVRARGRERAVRGPPCDVSRRARGSDRAATDLARAAERSGKVGEELLR